MNSIHQQPGDLVLAIHRTDHRPTVMVLKRCDIDGGATPGEWHFSFCILSESHLVCIEHQGVVILQELLMCNRSANNAHAYVHHFGDLQPHQYTTAGYRVTVDFGAVERWASIRPDEAFLEADFPEVQGRVPTTRIAWSQANGVMRWRTLHIYPGVQSTIGVISESEFQV